MMEIIFQRMTQLRAIDTVENMIKFKVGRCHQLKGDRKTEYALDLIHPYRLIFIKDGIDDDIQIVKITSIEDYH